MNFVPVIEMKELREILDELLEVGEGLTDWEVEFIENLSKWEACFTEKQARTLRSIYERLY